MRSPEPSALPTALVVDDDHVMRMLEQETLAQFRFEVTTAEDGEQALARLEVAPPDLMLLDVDMPGLDGFEVCRRVRQRWDANELPVIMVTGMDDLDSINQAYESGANDFIAKPINWPILGHLARYILRAAQAVRSLRDLEQSQAAMVRAIPDMIFLFSRDGCYLVYKEGYGTAPFVPPEELIGRNVTEVLPADVAEVLQQSIVVFQDESGFTQHPRLGRGWALIGKRLKVPTTSQHQKRLNVSGWVAPFLGRSGVIQTERGNREGFLKVLQHLYTKLRGYTIWLYVDRARWHKGD